MASVASREPIPASRYTCFSRKGNVMRLPSNNLELAAAKGQYYLHIGLHLVESSIQIGRAMNEAIIFTFGLSGSGKSTTLNHLFGIELAKASGEESCTRDVSYFVSNMPSVDLKLDNLKIGFVDLPGWADSRGINFQAQNMAAIEQFIAEHPHLGSRTRSYFPNIVMIVVNANDNRAKGEASQAVIMLKAIKQLRIVDRKRHNVVIVMTHALSIPPNAIKGKKDLYQGHCRTILGFEPPFVYVENSYGEDYYNLPKEEDWTILNDENKTRQPYNVFKALIDQMKSNHDEVGCEAVKIFFSARNTFELKEEGRVKASNVSKNSVQKWLKRVVTNPTELCRDSEVSQIIDHHTANWANEEKQQFEPLLCELNHCGICTEAELKNLPITEVKNKLLPYVLHNLELELLINLFKVLPIDFPHLYPHILSTYTNTNGTFELMKENVFKDLPNSFYTSQGLLLPEFLKAQQSDKRIIDFTRQTSNLPSEESDVEDLVNDFTITFQLKEILYIIYFDVNDPTSITKFKFIEDFKIYFENLPTDENDLDLNLEEYREFFEKYGELVMIGSACGGFIEGNIKIRALESEFNLVECEYILQECIQVIISNEDGSIERLREAVPPNYADLIENLKRTPIQFHGGKAPLFCDCVENLSASKYNMWVKSLNNDLVIVGKFDRGNLKPLSEIVGLFDPEKGDALKSAQLRLEESTQVSISHFLTSVSSLFGKSVDHRDRTFTKSFLNTKTLEKISQIKPDLSKPKIDSNSSANHEQNDQQPNMQSAAITIQPPEPTNNGNTLTRAEASANIFHRAFLGFSGSSKVQVVLTDSENRLKEIFLRDLKTHLDNAPQRVDALCYFCERDNRVLSNVYFHPAPDTNKMHEFVVVTLKEGEIKLGYYQPILRCEISYKKCKESFVKAINLKHGDCILIYNKQSNKLKPSQIQAITSKCERGCYQPKSADYNLIVDLALIPNGCFPGNAIVTLRGGKKVRMDEVKVGDHVLSIHPRTGKPVYSKVYLWGHRDPHVTATFLHITHPHGHLHISANHLILSGEQRRPVPAGHLAVGDTIHSFLSPTTATSTATPAISVPVSHIHTCRQVGLYAPFTNNGLIVVDGIASSVYAHLSPPPPPPPPPPTTTRSRSHAHVCARLTGGLVARFGMHRVGECVMTPVRVACKFPVGSLFFNKQINATTHIHKYCQWLMKMCYRCKYD